MVLTHRIAAVAIAVAVVGVLSSNTPIADGAFAPAALTPSRQRGTFGRCNAATGVRFADDEGEEASSPTTFREAEVIGLRLMQEGKHEDALRAFKTAIKLPGSRPDVVRTKTLSGPSPVGGSQGGTEGKVVMNLDEFELQAAHYNIACACARLGNVPESVANLKLAFDCGFDNYATVRSDPDLSAVHGTAEFDNMMDQYDKKGLFGMFGKK